VNGSWSSETNVRRFTDFYLLGSHDYRLRKAPTADGGVMYNVQDWVAGVVEDFTDSGRFCW